MGIVKDQTNQRIIESRIKETETEENALNKRILELQKEADQKKKKRLHLQSQRKPDELIVSDHAKLRYLERVHGINMDQITQMILDHQIVNCHKTLGGAKAEFPDSTNTFIAVVKNNVVKTIIPVQ